MSFLWTFYRYFHMHGSLRVMLMIKYPIKWDFLRTFYGYFYIHASLRVMFITNSLKWGLFTDILWVFLYTCELASDVYNKYPIKWGFLSILWLYAYWRSLRFPVGIQPIKWCFYGYLLLFFINMRGYEWYL
jgi:hypothetical protein